MREAYAMGARHVVLLSDGLANRGGGPDRLLADAREQAARGVRIDTVGLGLDQKDGTLQAIAAASGGHAIVR
jgi:Mg-chelatase subunit ChlD